MTNNQVAAGTGPFGFSGWAVFVSGQIVRCPAPGATIPERGCNQGLGEPVPGTEVRVRIATSAQAAPSLLKRCPRCRTMLELQVLSVKGAG